MPTNTHPRIEALQTMQYALARIIWADDSDPAIREDIIEAYNVSVRELIWHLGEDADVCLIDIDMAEAFRNVYKSDNGFNPRGWAYANAKRWMDTREERQALPQEIEENEKQPIPARAIADAMREAGVGVRDMGY